MHFHCRDVDTFTQSSIRTLIINGVFAGKDNTTDCVVGVLGVLYCKIDDHQEPGARPLTFTSKDFDRMRYRFAFDILCGKLCFSTKRTTVKIRNSLMRHHMYIYDRTFFDASDYSNVVAIVSGFSNDDDDEETNAQFSDDDNTNTYLNYIAIKTNTNIKYIARKRVLLCLVGGKAIAAQQRARERAARATHKIRSSSTSDEGDEAMLLQETPAAGSEAECPALAAHDNSSTSAETTTRKTRRNIVDVSGDDEDDETLLLYESPVAGSDADLLQRAVEETVSV
jgi:hypothetical protein